MVTDLAGAEDDIVPAARRLGVGLVPYSPLGRGMLTGVPPPAEFEPGGFRAGDARFHGRELAGNLALVAAVRLTPADLERLEAAAPRAAWAGDRQSFAAYGSSRMNGIDARSR